MNYPDYINYVGRFGYQIWQLALIYKKMGGNLVLPGYKGNLKGVSLFSNEVEVHKHPEWLRVYVGHGVSNKRMNVYFGDKGKDRYDYYWTSGPKYSEALKQHGYGITEENEVKIGNLRFDWYFNKYNKWNVIKKLNLHKKLKTIVFAPTYQRSAFEHCEDAVWKLAESYNLILKPHPFEEFEHEIDHKNVRVFKGDIADILWVADVLLSDESSVAYDFTITGKPIVMCPPVISTTFQDDDKYNLMKHTAIYRSWTDDDIMEKIEEAYDRTDEVKQLCKDAFWYMDGNATDRACEWIKKIIDERFE